MGQTNKESAMHLLVNHGTTAILLVAQAFLGTLVIGLVVVGLLWTTTKVSNLGHIDRA